MTIPESRPSDRLERPDRGKPSGRSELYLALTPYHVFLACGLACRKRCAAELIVYESIPSTLLEAIRAWRACPFKSIEVLPNPNRRKSLARQVWCSHRNVQRLRTGVCRRPFEAAFFFNDGVAETQAVMNELKRQGETRIHLVEDGMPMYSSVLFPHDPHLYKRVLRKLFYGSWWVDIDVLGSTPWVDQIWASFPDRVRHELSAHQAGELAVEWFKGPDLKSLARAFLTLCGCDLSFRGQSYALCVLEHSTAVTQREPYQAILDQACRQAIAVGKTPILKYHPAEPEADPYDLERLELAFLPKDLGVEFLYVSGLPITEVLGNATNALATARWLLEATRVISIAPRLGPMDPGTEQFFADIGVALVREDTELLRQMSS